MCRTIFFRLLSLLLMFGYGVPLLAGFRKGAAVLVKPAVGRVPKGQPGAFSGSTGLNLQTGKMDPLAPVRGNIPAWSSSLSPENQENSPSFLRQPLPEGTEPLGGSENPLSLLPKRRLPPAQPKPMQPAQAASSPPASHKEFFQRLVSRSPLKKGSIAEVEPVLQPEAEAEKAELEVEQEGAVEELLEPQPIEPVQPPPSPPAQQLLIELRPKEPPMQGLEPVAQNIEAQPEATRQKLKKKKQKKESTDPAMRPLAEAREPVLPPSVPKADIFSLQMPSKLQVQELQPIEIVQPAKFGSTEQLQPAPARKLIRKPVSVFFEVPEQTLPSQPFEPIVLPSPSVPEPVTPVISQPKTGTFPPVEVIVPPPAPEMPTVQLPSPYRPQPQPQLITPETLPGSSAGRVRPGLGTAMIEQVKVINPAIVTQTIEAQPFKLKMPDRQPPGRPIPPAPPVPTMPVIQPRQPYRFEQTLQPQPFEPIVPKLPSMPALEPVAPILQLPKVGAFPPVEVIVPTPVPDIGHMGELPTGDGDGSAGKVDGSIKKVDSIGDSNLGPKPQLSQLPRLKPQLQKKEQWLLDRSRPSKPISQASKQKPSPPPLPQQALPTNRLKDLVPLVVEKPLVVGAIPLEPLPEKISQKDLYKALVPVLLYFQYEQQRLSGRQPMVEETYKQRIIENFRTRDFSDVPELAPLADLRDHYFAIMDPLDRSSPGKKLNAMRQAARPIMEFIERLIGKKSVQEIQRSRSGVSAAP